MIIQCNSYFIDKTRVSLTLSTIQTNNINNKDYVLARVIYCGICNSDIKEINNERISRRDFGHELLAQILQTSTTVNIPINQYVVLDPHIKIERGTGFSEYLLLTGTSENLEKALIKVPSKSVVFTCVEPLACALHAIKRLFPTGKDILGKRVLIHGCGTFGYLMFLILKYYKADVKLSNRDLIRLNYIHDRIDQDIQKLDSEKDYDFFDSIIIAQSFINIQDIEALVPYANKFCNILLFGAIHKNEHSLYEIRNKELNLSANISNKNVTLVGSLGAKNKDFKDSIKLLNDIKFRKKVTKYIVEIVDKEKGLKIINNMALKTKKYYGKIVVKFA
ncbi:MAG: alcohol dehydrogenase catalytic domain-containing protein [Rickettsiaceae bacterium]|nr:alcohol dehydrogenase catalytic domain-containing protein [Rickettsiaceae bacterium]